MSKIIVFGKDPEFILNTSKVLEAEFGAEIITAYSGAEILKTVQANSPDLVVIDSCSSDVDAMAVSRTLKNNLETKYIPLLLVAGQCSIQTIKQVVEFGADNYLIRPAKNDLLAHVHALLRIKRNYDHLRQKLSKAHEADSERFGFVSQMSHELRSPLNSILGFTELISGEHYGPINSKQRKYLVTIEKNGRRLLNLTDNICLLVKLEAGKIEVNSDCSSLCKLVQNVWMNLQGKAQSKSIHFECTIPPEFDQVNSDRRLLSIVLENLLDNAIKFNNFGGKIMLICHGSKGDRAGSKVTIRLSDTGKGILPEDVPKLFSPFPRIKKQKDEQGTGLGLVICKEIIDLVGGEIQLESEVGVGTTLYISFFSSI